jgi:hypothetical protein
MSWFGRACRRGRGLRRLCHGPARLRCPRMSPHEALADPGQESPARRPGDPHRRYRPNHDRPFKFNPSAQSGNGGSLPVSRPNQESRGNGNGVPISGSAMKAQPLSGKLTCSAGCGNRRTFAQRPKSHTGPPPPRPRCPFPADRETGISSPFPGEIGNLNRGSPPSRDFGTVTVTRIPGSATGIRGAWRPWAAGSRRFKLAPPRGRDPKRRPGAASSHAGRAWGTHRRRP